MPDGRVGRQAGRQADRQTEMKNLIVTFRNFTKACKIFHFQKFYENPSIRSLIVPCGRTDVPTGRQADRQTEMKKLIVTFRNFANSSKNFRFKNALNYLKKKRKFLKIATRFRVRKFKSHDCAYKEREREREREK